MFSPPAQEGGARESELPQAEEMKIGGVGAEKASVDSGLEMMPKDWVVGNELLQSGFNGPRHVYPRPLGRGCGSALSPSQPNRTGDLLNQEVPLLLDVGSARGVVECPGFRELCPQFLQPALVRSPSLRIEDRPGIPEPGHTDPQFR